MPQLLRLLTILSLVASAGTSAQSASPQDVELALRAINLMCLSGGRRVTITQKSKGEVSVGQAGAPASEVTLDSSSAEGFINGIDNTISSLGADQADKARACMKPYIQRILSLIIPPPQPQPKPPSPNQQTQTLVRHRNPPPHYTYDANGCLHRTPHGFFLGLPHIPCTQARLP
jgi:hypothetical protein